MISCLLVSQEGIFEVNDISRNTPSWLLHCEFFAQESQHRCQKINVNWLVWSNAIERWLLLVKVNRHSTRRHLNSFARIWNFKVQLFIFFVFLIKIYGLKFLNFFNCFVFLFAPCLSFHTVDSFSFFLIVFRSLFDLWFFFSLVIWGFDRIVRLWMRTRPTFFAYEANLADKTHFCLSDFGKI